MSLAKGSKVENPHVRATAKNGTIHAVNRPNQTAESLSASQQKSLCGKATVVADQPLRRYQQGLGKECVACTSKVVAARLLAIKERKALRSVKNQVAKSETFAPEQPKKVAKSVAKKAPAKKAAPAKAAKVRDIKTAPSKKAPAKKSVGSQARAPRPAKRPALKA